jgi:hypothetical protein
MPIQRRLADNADAQAARQAASWFQELPPDADVWLLLSASDPTSFWYGTRLTYEISPRRLSIAINTLPAAARHADALLAFGSARATLPPGWILWRRGARVLLFRRVGPHPRPLPQEQGRGDDGGRLFRPVGRLAAGHTARDVVSLGSGPQRPGTSLFPLWLRALAGLWSLCLVILLGALLLGVTLRAPPFAWWWANLALAHLTGAAALTWLLLMGLLLTGHLSVWPVYLALLLLLPTGRRACTRLFPANRTVTRPTQPERKEGSRGKVSSLFPLSSSLWEWGLLAVIALGVFTALERGLLIGLDWDGFMIWQLKAKAFFLDGNVSLLHDPGHFPYAHLDYPLLVPLQTWWTYAHFGAVSERWAQTNGLLFYADVLLLFAAAVHRYLARPVVLLGLALLAGLPELTMHAVSGYADVPLAAYFLALGICLLRPREAPEPTLTWLMAWMLAGMVLTKNEGLLACLAALVVAVLMARRAGDTGLPEGKREEGSGKRSDAGLPVGKRFLLWVGMAAVAYFPWFLMKRAWHLTNDVLQPTKPLHFTARLLWWRLAYALFDGFAAQLGRVGPWFPAWGLVGLLFIVGLAASLRRRIALCNPLWLLAGLQVLGYIGIYLITPASLPAHVGSSVERLVLHVVPTLLLASLLGCFASSSTLQAKDSTRHTSDAL